REFLQATVFFVDSGSCSTFMVLHCISIRLPLPCFDTGAEPAKTAYGLFDRRRILERVERSRTRHGPLETRCAVPRLVARLFESATAAISRQRDREQEVHLRETEAECADGDDLVPVGELRRVVGVATRHACKTDEVHRQEREVEEDQRRPEVDLA